MYEGSNFTEREGETSVDVYESLTARKYAR